MMKWSPQFEILLLKITNIDPHQKPGLNPGAREV